VKTESEGKEPHRYIVVIPDNLEDPNLPAVSAQSERRDRNNRDRGGYNRGGKGGNFKGNKGGFNKPRNNAKKNFNQGNKSGANSGGTSLKTSSDFFGIFLGNSGNSDKE
jgi:hypothetical protein